MKKILCVLLTLAMVLCFAACGSDKESNISTFPAVETNAPVQLPDVSIKADTSILGTISGNTYTNNYFGFRVTMPEDWQVYSLEDMTAMLQGTSTDLDGLMESLTSMGVTYGMYAASSELYTANVVIEDMTITAGTAVSESEYVQTAAASLPSALGSMGMTDVTADCVSVNFVGQTHSAIEVSGLIQGTPFYELVICVKAGNYMCSITLGGYDMDTLNTLMASFTAA